MKVAILIESMNKRGGTEIVADNLCTAFKEDGTECIILTLQPYTGVNDCVVWLGSRPCQSVIKQWIIENQITTIINFTHETIKLLRSKIPGVKRLAVFHWSVKGYEDSIMSLCEKKPSLLQLIAKLKAKGNFNRIHKAMRRLDACVALTHEGEKELRSMGVKKTVVIPNFLPYTHKYNGFEKKRDNTMIYVGRLSSEKGVFLLLEIWEKIIAQRPEMKLKIYGIGSERSAMNKIIADRNIPNVSFMGFVSDATEIYQNAQVLLCPSETEGFGMVLLEAMYHGVVPVAFDCPVSPRELIGSAGFTVPCFDVNSFAHRALEIISDNELFATLQKKGMMRAAQFYKPAVISKWNRLIEKNT